MRASCCARTAALVAAFCITLAQSHSQAGISSLDPAFRLPAGGLALAGPVLDTNSSPATAWLLSEDLSLYALTETGSLVARVDLTGDAGSERPSHFLAVDPFGRAVVSFGGSKLAAYTRMGARAWQASIERVEGDATAFPPAFGSDGRAFVLSGKGLICLNPAGLRLWTLPLPSPPSCPPGVDGRGNPCVGLEDGSLIIASPYGERMQTVSLGSSPRLIFPLCLPPGGETESPCLAVGMRDGRILFIGTEGEIKASYRLAAEPLSLAGEGTPLYGLDSSGRAFAVSAAGKALWSLPTGCMSGRLFLFAERIVAVGQGRAVSLSLGGEVLRELTVPAASGTPAVSPAGLVFSSGRDWVLAAYRFEKSLGALGLPALAAYADLPDSVSRVLSFGLSAADSDAQLKRLANIENSLRSGTIGKDEPEAEAYCAAVATGTLGGDLSRAERRRAGSSLARSNACHLLGDLGSPAYRAPLFRVLEADDDPVVRAAACDAIAELGVDKDGRSMAALLAAARRPLDEITAFGIASAIEGLTLRSGMDPSEDGLRTLIRLTTLPYGQTVRNRALAALGRIAGTIK
jgi:outer membrane protein assembly factor BamB